MLDGYAVSDWGFNNAGNYVLETMIKELHALRQQFQRAQICTHCMHAIVYDYAYDYKHREQNKSSRSRPIRAQEQA